MIEPEPYITNAVALWSSLSQLTEPAPGVVRAETPWVIRTFTTRPTPAETLLALVCAEAPGKPVVLEDSFGADAEALPLPQDVTLKHMPVMIRPAGPVTAAEGDITQVTSEAEYDPAQQVIIDGFPARSGYPASILGDPQWALWLARRDGVPAAAMYTFDDGSAAGIYLLATLPEHRGHGLAKAVLTHAMSTMPTRTTVLVATDDGQPLYEKLGFQKVSNATWYLRRSI